MLAILGALKEEVSDLKKRLTLKETIVSDNCYFFRGSYGDKPVLLAQTGAGRERAEAATRWILDRYQVTGLVSLGFAGALTENWQIGDVVLCEKLRCANGLEAKPHLQLSEEPCFSDTGLVDLALKGLKDSGIKFRRGISLAVNRPALKPETKRALGQALPVDIAEMESFWIARLAQEKCIPFLAIRAISDTVEEKLPPLEPLLEDYGAGRWDKVALKLLAHPRDWLKMFRLYRNTRRARRNLTAAAECLLTKL